MEDPIKSLPPTEPFEKLRKEKLQFYLFGEHLSGSKAPILHNSIYKALGLSWNYSIYETRDKNVFNEMLNSSSCIGCAVTMPNKIEFAKEVDILDKVGQGVGSINTVYTRKDKDGKNIKIGTNTDTIGIYQAFMQNEEAKKIVENYKGKPGLVYGGGGACRSAVYALHELIGCSRIYVINRDHNEVDELKRSVERSGLRAEIVHVETPEFASMLERPELAVLTVPDFPPVTKQEKLAKATLDILMRSKRGAVLEMCYHPRIYTRLYREFEENGWNVIDGSQAMIYQGLEQIMLWSGHTLEELPVELAKEEIKSNI
ncbi:uncharacterized protein PRCAT00000020001 [Priceomyces carsonii]|uniref:uncharacterized protein n=1 Tax=Priceomyces carsonii TaxID=28549 RepID=UPI002EDAB065|nr:unnamed protein product [Priceomyces carsonii]